MKRKYQTAFILPVGANKLLGADGWEFKSSAPLSHDIKENLVQSLRLEFFESYLGIESYISDNMKMSVFFDEKCKVESITFQLYGDALSKLSTVCQSDRISSDAELFIPQQD